MKIKLNLFIDGVLKTKHKENFVVRGQRLRRSPKAYDRMDGLRFGSLASTIKSFVSKEILFSLSLLSNIL